MIYGEALILREINLKEVIWSANRAMSEVDISSLKEVIVLQADQEGIRLVAISSHPLREDEQEEMEVVLTDVLSDFPDVGEVDIEYRLDSEAPEEGVRAWPEV